MSKELNDFKKKVRLAFAEYQRSEGCSCCRDNEAHIKNEKIIAELVDAKPYHNGDGYDFTQSKYNRKKP